MKCIPLTQGKFALVDDEDFERLNQYKWHCSAKGYAVRTEQIPRTKNKITFWMHREIVGTPKGMETDHKDQNTLNNQRGNLRTATKGQNQYNQKKHSNNTSGFRGVYFNKQKQRFCAQIAVNKKNIHIGFFKTIEEAVSAHDLAAIEFHGKFAKINNV